MEYTTEIINISKIKEGFFIGDRMAGTNLNVLLQFKISHMINSAGNQIINQFQTLGVRTLTLNWTENQNQKLLDSKDEIPNRLVSFIDDAIKNGEGLLAYSVRGQNRVCIVVILYLMRKYNWSLKKCLTFLNTKKKDIDIPKHFLIQLFEYEKRLINNNNNIQLSDNWQNYSKVLDSDEYLIRNTYINSLQAKKINKNKLNKDKLGYRHIEWGDNNPFNKNSQLIYINNLKNDLIFQKNPKKIITHEILRPKKSCIKIHGMHRNYSDFGINNFGRNKSMGNHHDRKGTPCELNKLINLGMDIKIVNKINEINNNFNSLNLANKNNNKSLNNSLNKKKKNNITNKQNNINININVNHSLINNDKLNLKQANLNNINNDSNIFNNLINIPISMNINSNSINKKINNKRINSNNIRKKRSNTYDEAPHYFNQSFNQKENNNFTKKLYNHNDINNFQLKMNNSANNFYTSNNNNLAEEQNKKKLRVIIKNNQNNKNIRSITPNNPNHNKNFLSLDMKNLKNNYRLINEYLNNITNYNNYINDFTTNKKIKIGEEKYNNTNNDSMNNNSFLTNNKYKKIQNYSYNSNYSYNYNLKLNPKNKKNSFYALKKINHKNMLNIPLDNGNPIKLNNIKNRNPNFEKQKNNERNTKKIVKIKRPNTADQKDNTMKNLFNSNWFKSVTEICGNTSQGFYKYNKLNVYKFNKRAPSPLLHHGKNINFSKK